MSEQFCTLFDKNYLLQAVTLYRSLEQHAGEFVLHAICMDEPSLALISRLGRANLVAVPVSALETDEVRAVRARTTHGQFCWVCQPLSCLHLLDKLAIPRITYLEADSLFFADPALLFAELGSGSACVVPHKFSKGNDHTAVAGKHCVQFNAFRNTVEGRAVLGYWKSECFKYSKDRPQLYPGQTCLDHWSSMFPDAKELQHPGAGVAPWNVQSAPITERGGQVFIGESPVVFFHYHQYARYPDGAHELGEYRLSRATVDLLYRPYARELEKTAEWIRAVDPAFTHRRVLAGNPGLVRALRRRLTGRYNVYRSL